jgi:hypothetical protein
MDSCSSVKSAVISPVHVTLDLTSLAGLAVSLMLLWNSKINLWSEIGPDRIKLTVKYSHIY